jgi:hypothetical protein
MHACHVQNDGEEISREAALQDLRARYLHAVTAVYGEGFEKGYLNGEQQVRLLMHSVPKLSVL